MSQVRVGVLCVCWRVKVVMNDGWMMYQQWVWSDDVVGLLKPVDKDQGHLWPDYAHAGYVGDSKGECKYAYIASLFFHYLSIF